MLGIGATDQPIRDCKERRWRYLNFFQYQAWIHAEVPRVHCGKCGKTTQVAVPWARAGSDFTLVLEAFLVGLCQEMPVLAMARLVGVSDDRVWRVLDAARRAARVLPLFGESRMRCGSSRKPSRHKWTGANVQLPTHAVGCGG